MARIWDGPTPYDDQQFEWAIGGSMAGLKKDVQGVHRAAMRSPLVRNMWEALCAASSAGLPEPEFSQVRSAAIAYEAGLVEE
ncbi:MAG: hypothetical protein Q8P59_08430 [Dehalococcoidia bacterium]|nr:hypothetical protein [Dehalococcoidia bacterium]